MLRAAGRSTRTAQAEAGKPYEPVVGQPGRDVPWVPNPPIVVEKMLDLAKVGPQDVVIDLRSGDGRAKRIDAKNWSATRH